MVALRMKVEQVGDDLLVRIPKSVARRNEIIRGSLVSLAKVDANEKPVAKTRRRSPFKLKDLLAKGRGKARGGELDLGGPVGKEVF